MSTQTAEIKDWLKWLKSYGTEKFIAAFMQNAHGAQGTCTHCAQPIYLDLLEGGGVADWKTADGDYGCSESPDTCEEETGNHFPIRLEEQ